MSKAGFATPIASDDGDARIREIEERSIPIEEIKYHTTTIGDYEDHETLQLPIGIFIDGKEEDSPKERVVDFTIRQNIHLGDFDEFLANLDPKEGESPKKCIDTISMFLGGGKIKEGYHLGAIESLGGIDFREFVQRTRYSSGAQLISNMFLGDVATVLFAARMQIGEQQGIDEETGEEIDKCQMAVERICPVAECKEKCRSIQSLKGIKIKSIPGLEDKPLFKYTLQNPISDGRSVINNVYLEPLKLYQLGLFISGNKPPDIEMLIAMIAAIPESEVYGRKAGNPFCSDLYKKMSIRDISALKTVTARLSPGPVALIEDIECACGQESFPHQINWVRTPRNFLYQSFSLTAEDL
jgi:hypothetical protein